MEQYNSFEEFIFINKRYPTVEESKQLYATLWNRYVINLDDNNKNIAIINDKLQDYENGELHDQKETVKVIAQSTERLKKQLGNKKEVVSIYYNERWGIYSIYVVVNCWSFKNLYKFRTVIPNFFEGWEVKLIKASFMQRIIKIIKGITKGGKEI